MLAARSLTTARHRGKVIYPAMGTAFRNGGYDTMAASISTHALPLKDGSRGDEASDDVCVHKLSFCASSALDELYVNLLVWL